MGITVVLFNIWLLIQLEQGVDKLIETGNVVFVVQTFSHEDLLEDALDPVFLVYKLSAVMTLSLLFHSLLVYR